MIKIDDENRLLNLNHTVIYLLVTHEENELYGDKLKNLNRYAQLTKGLFRFDIVEKGDNPYDKLPEDLVNATKTYNVMVRLINSIHGIYCYGLEQVDITADIKDIVAKLKEFIKEVCKQNINNLEILEPRASSPSSMAVSYYKAHHLFADVFDCALHMTAEDSEEARRIIENVTNSDDAKESRNQMLGVVNNDYAPEIERKRLEREHPLVCPEISVAIKKVPTGKVSKNGTVKKGLGIEITINNEPPIPVYLPSFGGKHLAFLYLAILFAIKEGKSIYKNDFVYGTKTKDRLEKLKRQFKTLKLTGFETFIAAVSNAPYDKRYDRINDAKSKVNTALWNILHDQYKDAYHYLCINTVTEDSTNSRYRVRLSKKQISCNDIVWKYSISE